MCKCVQINLQISYCPRHSTFSEHFEAIGENYLHMSCVETRELKIRV
jgi:hypothetical protein